MKKKTPTQRLAEKNATEVRRQRKGRERTAQLHRAVADGKLTAGEALLSLCEDTPYSKGTK